MLTQASRYFAVRSAVMVDEGGRAEPQLGAVLTTRVHDAEVVDAGTQEPRFLVVSELRQTTDETTDLLSFQPSPPPSFIHMHGRPLRQPFSTCH